MHGYGHFCPVARAAEIFAERWTPLLIRELLAGHGRFNQLRRGSHLAQRAPATPAAPGAGGGRGASAQPRGRRSPYRLTEAGLALGEVVIGLGTRGQRWLEPEHHHLDAEALAWAIFTRLERYRLPERRVVVKLSFHAQPRSYWLLLSREQPEVCFTNPGWPRTWRSAPTWRR